MKGDPSIWRGRICRTLPFPRTYPFHVRKARAPPPPYGLFIYIYINMYIHLYLYSYIYIYICFLYIYIDRCIHVRKRRVLWSLTMNQVGFGMPKFDSDPFELILLLVVWSCSWNNRFQNGHRCDGHQIQLRQCEWERFCIRDKGWMTQHL